jgi:hypothetical protein
MSWCRTRGEMHRYIALGVFVACARAHTGQGDRDAQIGAGDAAQAGRDAATSGDSGLHDASIAFDVAHDAAAGVITGGPCTSGHPGATAYRIRWANAGGQAQVVYEVDGFPDKTRDHAGAYGYVIGFTPSFVDPYLGDGGLQLDDSDFVDLEVSTAGVSSITSATLSLYGRSYNTTASGSFNWQTFVGTGASPTNSVSNVAPYHWDSADVTTELAPNDATTLIRIKAGPASDALVVNRIELCIVAS